MGLDVTFYKTVTLVRAMTVKQANDEDYDPYPEQETLLYLDHPDRTQHDGMLEGSYSYDEAHGMCAGSYSGYNRWRSMLAAMLGTTAEAVWDDPQPSPFVELIHFADNEGFMGATTCAKLAKDFAVHRDRAAKYAARSEDGDQFLYRYDEWAFGFAFVGPAGACKFH